MSDSEPDEEILSLLRQSLGISDASSSKAPNTEVLEGAQHVYHNSIDVALDTYGTKTAAAQIWSLMQEKSYSFKTWSEHSLHPRGKDEATVNFIFLMDLLNFCFWSESSDPHQRYAVEYQGQRWTGYWSLVAAIHRAVEEDIPITTPSFWTNYTECTHDLLKHVFRSATPELIPLIDERIACIREAGRILVEDFNGSVPQLIQQAKQSATALVNLLVINFPCFKDIATFESRSIHFYKRAQIFVADLWACFEGQNYGCFHDIDTITMFADYRIPQMLHSLGCLRYSPSLESRIRNLKELESGGSWEVQLRGCSIWCVELIRKEILRQYPKAEINAILIDFFLYDTMKEREVEAVETIPHHRTRSIWY
ncbi:MAG: hypothetical protein L6R38_001321 [Xanthoria sp. 2 TBL-2021]|nr:MAG: hypothetical protein L6R38_001321 [Xanthoria sp. 2 TBL-2021]